MSLVVWTEIRPGCVLCTATIRPVKQRWCQRQGKLLSQLNLRCFKLLCNFSKPSNLSAVGEISGSQIHGNGVRILIEKGKFNAVHCVQVLCCSGTLIQQSVKELTKWVRCNGGSLCWGSFPYIWLLLGWRISFVMPGSLLYIGVRYVGR